MPHSWLRIPANTGRKIRDCMGNDHSKGKFHSCADKVVADDGGTLEQLWFEGNGRWAHAYVEYPDDEVLRRIILDLEAEQAAELYSADEIDQRIAENLEGYEAG
jgi:hypothetical protein